MAQFPKWTQHGIFDGSLKIRCISSQKFWIGLCLFYLHALKKQFKYNSINRCVDFALKLTKFKINVVHFRAKFSGS